jgi:threonine 3-dehydrogenase
MNRMKALVKKNAEPGLWLEEVSIPRIGMNDVLIKILKTSICGTDVHIYNWDTGPETIKVPMVIGHGLSAEWRGRNQCHRL